MFGSIECVVFTSSCFEESMLARINECSIFLHTESNLMRQKLGVVKYELAGGCIALFIMYRIK